MGSIGFCLGFLGISWVFLGFIMGQFLVQVIVSFLTGTISLAGIAFSKVDLKTNAVGTFAGYSQALLFAALTYLCVRFGTSYISYQLWNTALITTMVAFIISILYAAKQVYGKMMLTYMCAWIPYFFEASLSVPRNERVEFAFKTRSDMRNNS